MTTEGMLGPVEFTAAVCLLVSGIFKCVSVVCIIRDCLAFILGAPQLAGLPIPAQGCATGFFLGLPTDPLNFFMSSSYHVICLNSCIPLVLNKSIGARLAWPARD